MRREGEGGWRRLFRRNVAATFAYEVSLKLAPADMIVEECMTKLFESMQRGRNILYRGPCLRMMCFPSTSSAPGRFVLPFEQKVVTSKALANL
jgi:hypothetical protein